MFPRRIGQSGYNKRMRKSFFLLIRVIRMLAMDTSLWSDDVWVVDSTPGGTVSLITQFLKPLRRSSLNPALRRGFCTVVLERRRTLARRVISVRAARTARLRDRREHNEVRRATPVRRSLMPTTETVSR